jgi:hypothetical protein
MYYDASSTDYISTPSFAIPNTGILTVEAWMKSTINATTVQTIISDNNRNSTIGFIEIFRPANTNDFSFYYANGSIADYRYFTDFFQNLDNQWIHIVTVCDYTNKTLKAYRNGIQFGVTKTLTGTPQFPSINRVKYLGARNTTQ